VDPARPLPISVVVPARDAADTLGETLASLEAQRHADWEAIVVDDGSRDTTAEVAGRVAAAEPRARLAAEPAAGLAAARDAGLAAAARPWVLFLDADDVVTPDHLADLARAVAAEPAAGVACSGWARLGPGGAVWPQPAVRRRGDLFDALAVRSLFPVHRALVRRDLVAEVGGFDRDLPALEDWDLWQRVARTGARFVPGGAAGALYRVRPGAMSHDPERMLAGGLRVLARGPPPTPGSRGLPRPTPGASTRPAPRPSGPTWSPGAPAWPSAPAATPARSWSASTPR